MAHGFGDQRVVGIGGEGNRAGGTDSPLSVRGCEARGDG